MDGRSDLLSGESDTKDGSCIVVPKAAHLSATGESYAAWINDDDIIVGYSDFTSADTRPTRWSPVSTTCSPAGTLCNPTGHTCCNSCVKQGNKYYCN